MIQLHLRKRGAPGRPRAGIALTLTFVAALGVAYSAAARSVTLRAAPGLRYDQLRFAVTPGEVVSLELENADEMAHNVVIVKPGKRVEVIQAAQAMGADGAPRHFNPNTEAVIAATVVVAPDETARIEFLAPEVEGVYPYVCTFPGHGALMYGAMYVTRDPLPPLETDPNIPERFQARTTEALDSNVYVPGNRARVLREFMPDAGPAAIAVALPGGVNYCWDAGACRFRYAWAGGFVDIGYHKADGPAELLGDVFYRSRVPFPVSFGQDPQEDSEVEFLGYRLVHFHPEFRYRVDGVEVRELIQSASGGRGLEFVYTIPEPPDTVVYRVDGVGEVSVSSPTGEFVDGALMMDAERARQFSVVIEQESLLEGLE